VSNRNKTDSKVREQAYKASKRSQEEAKTLTLKLDRLDGRNFFETSRNFLQQEQDKLK
jgi:hypothetical protein